MKTPRLPLSESERALLRQRRLRLADFVLLPEAELQSRTGWMQARVAQLRSLSLFQQLPSVGPATAGDFLLLGFRHPQELAGQDPAALFKRLQQITRSQQDPCVLDVFACAIDHVTHPEVAPGRPWWYWSRDRLALGQER